MFSLFSAAPATTDVVTDVPVTTTSPSENIPTTTTTTTTDPLLVMGEEEEKVETIPVAATPVAAPAPVAAPIAAPAPVAAAVWRYENNGTLKVMDLLVAPLVEADYQDYLTGGSSTSDLMILNVSCYGKNLISYTLDFSDMSQTNDETKTVRDISRFEETRGFKRVAKSTLGGATPICWPAPATRSIVQVNQDYIPPNGRAVWRFQEENGDLALIHSQLIPKLEAAFQSYSSGYGRKTFSYIVNLTPILFGGFIVKRCFSYTIDFETGLQTNNSTGVSRDVYRTVEMGFKRVGGRAAEAQVKIEEDRKIAMAKQEADREERKIAQAKFAEERKIAMDKEREEYRIRQEAIAEYLRQNPSQNSLVDASPISGGNSSSSATSSSSPVVWQFVENGNLLDVGASHQNDYEDGYQIFLQNNSQNKIRSYPYSVYFSVGGGTQRNYSSGGPVRKLVRTDNSIQQGGAATSSI